MWIEENITEERTATRKGIDGTFKEQEVMYWYNGTWTRTGEGKRMLK